MRAGSAHGRACGAVKISEENLFKKTYTYTNLALDIQFGFSRIDYGKQKLARTFVKQDIIVSINVSEPKSEGPRKQSFKNR